MSTIARAGSLNFGIQSLELTDEIGVMPYLIGSSGRMRLSTESIGTFTLTLTNLVVGSAVRVETQAGALVEYRVADAATEVFTVPAYAPGNASNDLRIKVRKGTAAPFYKDYETLAVASVGAGSIYVVQVPD